MLSKQVWILLLSLIVSTNAFCGPDDGDDDELEQCQVCLESENLRQVCECLHNICMNCLQGLVTHSPPDKTQIPCPNCRRNWVIAELIDLFQLQRPVLESPQAEEPNQEEITYEDYLRYAEPHNLQQTVIDLGEYRVVWNHPDVLTEEQFNRLPIEDRELMRSLRPQSINEERARIAAAGEAATVAGRTAGAAMGALGHRAQTTNNTAAEAARAQPQTQPTRNDTRPRVLDIDSHGENRGMIWTPFRFPESSTH